MNDGGVYRTAPGFPGSANKETLTKNGGEKQEINKKKHHKIAKGCIDVSSYYYQKTLKVLSDIKYFHN